MITVMIYFIYEHINTQKEVRKHIKQCESKHMQQAVYSTFHDALTQICYGCLRVRSTIKLKELEETALATERNHNEQ